MTHADSSTHDSSTPSPEPTAAATAHDPGAPESTAHASAAPGTPEHAGELNEDGTPRKRLSATVGAVCLAGGVLGLAVPGLPGWPLLIIGASVLAPRVPILSKANNWMKEKMPEAHKAALKFEDRFLTDLEKRYPDKPDQPSASGPEPDRADGSQIERGNGPEKV